MEQTTAVRILLPLSTVEFVKNILPEAGVQSVSDFLIAALNFDLRTQEQEELLATDYSFENKGRIIEIGQDRNRQTRYVVEINFFSQAGLRVEALAAKNMGMTNLLCSAANRYIRFIEQGREVRSRELSLATLATNRL